MNEHAKQFIKDNMLEILFSIPKTVWFNFKVLPFRKAVKLPIVISYHIKVRGVNRRNFILRGHLSPASIRIGFGYSLGAIRENKKGLITIQNNGKIILEGKAGFSRGVILAVNSANLIVGDNFKCNYSSTIDCTMDDVTFGKDVVLGWKVTVRNGDGHTVIDAGKPKPISAPINIGNHVWLCANSTVLKGTNIGDNSIVAYGALLTKANGDDGVLYAGFPARPIRYNVTWEE